MRFVSDSKRSNQRQQLFSELMNALKLIGALNIRNEARVSGGGSGTVVLLEAELN